MDRAVVHAQSIEANTEMSVKQLATRKFTKPNHQRANHHDDFRRQQPSHSERNQPAETKCGHCGRSYPHEGGRESCPAFKQSCHNCGTVGHYAKLCRNKQAAMVKIRVKAVDYVLIVEMVDLAMCITSYTSSM